MTPSIDILLVEDDVRDIELTLHVLKSQGISNSVQIARDGLEAIELLFPKDATTTPCRPRCILLDLKMPKVPGLEVLKKIRESVETKSIPVVVLTSSRETTDLNMAYSLGANSYLCKPIELSAFSEMLKSFGTYWMRLNELPTY